MAPEPFTYKSTMNAVNTFFFVRLRTVFKIQLESVNYQNHNFTTWRYSIHLLTIAEIKSSNIFFFFNFIKMEQLWQIILRESFRFDVYTRGIQNHRLIARSHKQGTLRAHLIGPWILWFNQPNMHVIKHMGVFTWQIQTKK